MCCVLDPLPFSGGPGGVLGPCSTSKPNLCLCPRPSRAAHSWVGAESSRPSQTQPRDTASFFSPELLFCHKWSSLPCLELQKAWDIRPVAAHLGPFLLAAWMF